jgi:hypothetical protein
MHIHSSNQHLIHQHMHHQVNARLLYQMVSHLDTVIVACCAVHSHLGVINIITAGVDLEDHQLAHILTTSTCIKAGSAPVISANFARCGAVTQMLEGWNSMFQSKKYIRSNFLTLYQRKDTPLVPTHVKSGLWMRKVGHSHSLTARLVHCTTGHAPIGAFRSRFFLEESTACRCGFPMETVSHVLY